MNMNRRAFLAGLGLAPIAAYVAPAATDQRQTETPYYLIGEVNGVTGAVVFTGVRQFKFVV